MGQAVTTAGKPHVNDATRPIRHTAANRRGLNATSAMSFKNRVMSFLDMIFLKSFRTQKYSRKGAKPQRISIHVKFKRTLTQFRAASCPVSFAPWRLCVRLLFLRHRRIVVELMSVPFTSFVLIRAYRRHPQCFSKIGA